MKKLISAASALAIAASMVGSAVPFATGAADAKKTYELRAFPGKDGKEVSTTITAEQIAAGDVAIPVGFYYVESKKDTKGIRAQWTVNSKDGDASNKNVTFVAYTPNTEYFNDARDVKWGGDTYSTNKIIGFAGTLENNKRKGVLFNHVSPDTVAFSVDTQQVSSNCKNAFGSAVWTPTADGAYNYIGDNSDDYPVTVFEAVFAKGTPAGTYTLDFIDYADDPKAPQNSTCQVDSSTDGDLNKGNGGLELKSLTITILGNGDTPAPTQAPTEAPKPTEGDKPTDAPKPTQGGDVMQDFVITGKDYTINPGETEEVEFIVQSGGHKVVLTQCELDIPAPLTYELNDTNAYCVDDGANVKYTALGDHWTATFKDAVTADAVNLVDGEAIMVVDVTVPEGAAPGTKYNYGFKFYHVVEDAFKPVEFDCKVVYGTITVGGDVVVNPTEAPTDAPKPTEAPTQAPTQAPTDAPKPTDAPAPGTPVYGDSNCDGKVNIADVVVLNKWLNDAKSYDLTDQGKLNADCCDAKAGAEINAQDSDAIIKSIVHLVVLPTTADKL